MAFDGKTIVLITGANGGLGYATAKILLCTSSDYHVIVGSRKGYNGVEAVSKLQAMPNIKGTVSSVQLDVTDDASIALAAKEVEETFGRVDVLLNNAGICLLDPDMLPTLRKTLATNVIGAVAVTEGFKGLLRLSSAPRLVFVTSSMGSLTHAADPESPHFRTKSGLEVSEYRISKAALNMAMVQIGKVYPTEGSGLENLKTLGVDPGLNRTNLLGPRIMKSDAAKHLPEPNVGASLIASVVKGEHDDKLGRVVGKSGINVW
ncbi:putative short chain dehydrogenase/reductase [Rhizodiscina lignyota]|uniref:Short chain dehydrogenase/reductase n=1 Tax=Rhizodiscina lignyota TaxID=1504668 RepID=A0A9P4ICT1_9PEZI|nr:putative short chain dehydrogenase/reductase [Rhizodiscina lignyota]